MTHLGVRGRLFLVSFLLVLAAGTVTGVYLEGQLRGWLNLRMQRELLDHATVARGAIESVGGPGTVAALDPLVKRLGRGLSVRLTVVAVDGEVLGDSWVPAARVAGLERHDGRPEMRAAAKLGQGIARRHSATLDRDMLYVALPFEGDATSGFVRVATATEEVDQVVTRLRWMLFFAALVGLFVAVVMSFTASHLLSRGLRDLLVRARAMVGGAATVDGTPRDEIAGIAHSLTHLGGALEGVVGTLAQERDRFEGILEAMADAVVAMDARRHVTLINRAGLTLLGLDARPTDGPLLEALAPALREALAPALAGDAGSRDIDLPDRQLQARVTPQRQGGGVVLVLHDVTRLRRLETLRRDFVANVSHELRTPVSVISLNAETLLDGGWKDEKRAPQFLAALQRNAQRLSALVTDLLDISRIESGNFEVHPETVAVFAVARVALDAVEKLGADRGTRVELDVPPDLAARADRQALEHVLINLLENAVKYTPETGHVHLVAHADGGEVVIEVRDDGPGIPPEHRDRIFERFYRVDRGRAKHMGGTGLGLSIVKHLVASMKGTVAVEPNTPRGTVFRVRLPARAPGEPGPSPTGAPRSAPPESR